MTASVDGANNDAQQQLRTDRMRERSKQVHDHSTGQLKLSLILTSKPLYAETLNLFVPIYAFLEEALERQKKHPQLGQLYPLLPELARAPGFQKDVEFHTEGCTLETPKEVDEYVAHLQKLEDENPVALVAWYYHMYMAIFAGGFIIKKAVKKTMKLSSDQGVQAFCFTENPKTIRDKLKNTINNMDLTNAQEQVLYEEGIKVFARNDALMDNLRDGNAFKQAEADCSRFIAKVTVGVVVVIAAISIPLLQSKLAHV